MTNPKQAYRKAAGTYPNPAGLEAAMKQDAPIAEDLRELYAARNKGGEGWDGLCICNLVKRVSKAEAEVATLKEQVRELTQPVSDEEHSKFGILGRVNDAALRHPIFHRAQVDELLAARAK